ncbi:hypothetical protein BDQ17DRAFT_451371 [Cyathus striatus]|nr:hypothetical protein BDQ17DRAFT_451371 [Cyathus striatus]
MVQGDINNNNSGFPRQHEHESPVFQAQRDRPPPLNLSLSTMIRSNGSGTPVGTASSPWGAAHSPGFPTPPTPVPPVMYNKAKDPRLLRKDSSLTAPRALAASPSGVAAPTPIPASASIGSHSSASIGSHSSPPGDSSSSPNILGPAFSLKPFPATSPKTALPPPASPAVHASPSVISPTNAFPPPSPSPWGTFQFDPNGQGPISPIVSTHPPVHADADTEAHADPPERPRRPPVPPASEDERYIWRQRVKLIAGAIKKQNAYTQAESTLSQARHSLALYQSSSYPPAPPALLEQLADLESERDRLKAEADEAQEKVYKTYGHEVVPSERAVELEEGMEEQRREMISVARGLARTGGVLARALAVVGEGEGRIGSEVMEETRTGKGSRKRRREREQQSPGRSRMTWR